jgi:Flp pilus assembly protein TadD
MGTPAYMPPEQARGEVARIDARSDVFGLGAVLCEVLTGQPPYVGRDPLSVFGRAERADLAEARARLAGCGADPELLGLARSCLAPDPAGRPRDGGAVADAVTRYLMGVEERARRADLERAAAEARAAEERRRRRWQAVGAAAGLLLLLGVGGVGWWASLARAERNTAIESALPAVAAARDSGRWLEARAVLTQAEDRLGGGGPPALRAQLGQARADLELAAALDAARLSGTHTHGGGFDRAAVRDGYAAAFAGYGLTPDLPAYEVAARVGRSHLREALVAALDDWSMSGPDPTHRDWLLTAAERADPGGWCTDIRRALIAEDRAALERLAARPDVGRQSAVTLVRLGRALGSHRGDPVAAALLRRARQAHPSDFWVHEEFGTCSRALGRPGEAEAGYRAALALRPQSPGAHNNLGILLAQSPGRTEEAEAEYREALRLQPDDPTVRHNLGELLARLPGREAAAEAEYRTSLRLRPGEASTHYNLAHLLTRLPGRGADAEAEWREAIRISPNNADSHTSLGIELEHAGRPAEAEAAYREAIRLDPSYPEAHYNLGVTLVHQPGRAAEAEAEFREALRHRPEYTEAHLNLGGLLAGRPGQAAEAEAQYREALRLRHDLSEAHANLGDLLAAQPGRAAEAETHCREAVRLRPDAGAHRTLGLLLTRLPGRDAEAVADLRESLRLEPTHARTHYNLAATLARQPGREAEVEAGYRAAVRFDPEYGEARCNLGLILARQGRFAEALPELRRGHELGSRRPGWRYPSDRWVRMTERAAALEARLPALLAGREAPDPADLPDLARVCLARRSYAAAARFTAAALEAEPGLAASPATGVRYNGACAAVLAGDRAPAKLRAGLRRQALAWLRADLDAWTKSPGPPARDALRHWQADADLAGVRGAALAALPDAERRDWARLWAGVDEQLSGGSGVSVRPPQE